MCPVSISAERIRSPHRASPTHAATRPIRGTLHGSPWASSEEAPAAHFHGFSRVLYLNRCVSSRSRMYSSSGSAASRAVASASVVPRQAYLKSTDGRVWGRPLNGVESKYLLAGLANCGVCGGSFTARSRKHGRQRMDYYQCQVNLARGRAICPNDLIMPLQEAETAVRHTVEHHLLRADVIADALAQALAQLQPPPESWDKHRKELEGQLTKMELELGRLTEAIVAGANVNTIVEAMQDRDRRRTQVRQELQALDRLAKSSQIDRAEVEARLRGIVSDWKDPLSGDTSQARLVLRKLLDGRLKFSPKLDENDMPYYEFSGAGVLDSLITGAVSGTGNGSSDRPFNDLKRWWPQRDSNPCFSHDHVFANSIQ
jgi:hypothetical protein